MYLGIDIGGTRLKAGLVDCEGRILRTGMAATPHSREALKAALAALIRQILTGESPRAVGIGCKGVVDVKTTEVLAIPGVWGFLSGIRLNAVVRPLVPDSTPVAADNDAKATLAGEMVWGAARSRANVLLLTLGTGVGGAILADGRILRGAGGVAGHLGHVSADAGGPPCFCGNYGCLEAVFSSRAIEAEAWTAVHQGCLSPMTEALRADPALLTCRFVFDHAAAGDAIAKILIERKIRLFGAALAGLLHALDPEIVILTGSIAEAGPALFEPLQSEVDWRVKGLMQRSVPLVPSGVADNSGVVGAAGLAYLASGTMEA